jgi:iron(III) transport system substrate-binding protein
MTQRIAVTLVLLLFAGCWSPADQEVVVYSALDQEFSQPILRDFAATSGIEVADKYDVESTKTVGLVQRIIQERGRPACDVFWNNEILHTLRLERMGLLEAYILPNADDFPQNFRSPVHFWHGLAARARVLVVNTKLVPEDQRPRTVRALIDPQWKNQVGIAKPLFGTTATHSAVLFATWGESEARDFFLELKANARILSGNKQVASSVARGQLAFGLTDTDDAIIEMEQGYPLEIVFPDQGAAEMGALFIPNTICLIRNGPHPEKARRLVDHLFQPAVEIRLAQGPSAQFPLNARVSETSRVMPDKPLKWMEVDFSAAADAWDAAAPFVHEQFVAAD